MKHYHDDPNAKIIIDYAVGESGLLHKEKKIKPLDKLAQKHQQEV
jgi:hypothetical protein